MKSNKLDERKKNLGIVPRHDTPPGNDPVQSGPHNRSSDLRNLWTRNWYQLNEIAAHATLLLAITAVIFVVHRANHIMQPPDGMMLLDGPPPFRIPFDWALTVSELGILSRFAWSSFKVFGRSE